MDERFLYDHQLKALSEMHNGCILCGGTGSGKSRTSIAYYYLLNGGEFKDGLEWGLPYTELTRKPITLVIITTAKKRDDHDWDKELSAFWLHPDKDLCHYDVDITVDSWNNIKKYKNVRNAFFIFDEQRVVGSGMWVKSFLEIARNNQWVLLSATPGDTWTDYIPVFVANGFYRNKTEFNSNHVVFNPYIKYPVIDRYFNMDRLERLRSRVLIPMDFERHTIQHHEKVFIDFDREQYKFITKSRWNIFEGKPLKNASEFCYCLRKLVNSHPSRIEAVLKLAAEHPRLIVFYNYDYELEILREAFHASDHTVGEWNGHKHQPVPDTIKWIYLVQYNAGSEGWNCVSTDTLVFFSQNYSYKVVTQATGRIDRMNTPYVDLYYYHLLTNSGLDLAIGKALTEKRKFNEKGFSDLK